MNSISYLAQTVDRALNNESTNPSQIIPRENSGLIHRDSKDNLFKEPGTSVVSKTQQQPQQSNTDSGSCSDNSSTKTIINSNDNNNDNNSSTLQNNNINDNNNETTLTFIIRIILYVPNLIIIRPLLFTWFIITFPLNLLESQKSSDNDEDENDPAYIPDEDSMKSSNNDDQNLTDSEPSSITPSPILSPQTSATTTTIPEMDEETESLAGSGTGTIIDLKSPTSPTSSALSHLNSRNFSFPKFVFPVNLINSNTKKTLILDLDETLVHSLSRGVRNSNGHMIEVKLNNQVATLYYVYKRPYCDHFLKQVSKWFNLVIFTASVKEYADPVIDWLESEKKYFSHRYYRNHCTLRDGQGYIKDLAIVDKNLHNLIIIDNSPISYALHENNAIIVEGWINDPSDSDLLNLIPMLNGLRYTTDVRSILGLKNGEIALEK